jgi:hypothetical protein
MPHRIWNGYAATICVGLIHSARSRCCAVRRTIGFHRVRLDQLLDWSNSNAGSRRRHTVTEVIRAAAELQACCDSHGWRYCFIGGLALQRWGEPRETIDVDLTLLTGFGNEQLYVQLLLQHFEPRIDGAVEFALTRRVLLAQAASGVGLDIALGGLPFEESAVARSSMFPFPPALPLRTCSAEDLIVMKAFAARTRDWADIEGILIRQSGRLDWAYIHQFLDPLVELKEAPAILADLERRRAEFDRQA